MSLELSFRRLVLQSGSVCRQCRRAFASPAQLRQEQSATGGMHDLLQASRIQDASQPSPSRSTPPPRAGARSPASAMVPPSPNSPAAAINPRNSQAALDLQYEVIHESHTAAKAKARTQALADLERTYTRKDLELQMTRRWKVGDVYAPHDLSGVEMSKWKKVRRRPRAKRDVLDELGINPLEHYKNFSMMSEYVSDMGRIKHSSETGLRPVNQRRMAKAIRRAIGMGLMPSVYRHPEILRAEMAARAPRR